MEFLDRQFFGNALLAWLIAAFAATAVWALFPLLKRRYATRALHDADRTAAAFDLLLRLMNGTTQIFAGGVALYIASRSLSLHPTIARGSTGVLLIIASIQAARWALIVFDHFIERHRARRGSADAAFAGSIAAIRFVARVAIWSLALLLVLDNLGVDVTALMTGLGVGGVAVALAAQSLLRDLLGALSIALDRPFEMRDVITVAGLTGRVEHLGLKSTRLRSSSGEQIVVPNTGLVREAIRNFGRMDERRGVLVFSVAYETPLKLVKRVTEIAAHVVREQPGVRLDRCHLRDFGSSGFNFEVVFFVEDARMDALLTAQQDIFIALQTALGQEGTKFAYPALTIELDAPPTLNSLS